MEDQESKFGLQLMKLVLFYLLIVLVLTLIKQTVPQLLQYSWGTITSVIQLVKANFEMVSSMVVIFCGMELVMGL